MAIPITCLCWVPLIIWSPGLKGSTHKPLAYLVLTKKQEDDLKISKVFIQVIPAVGWVLMSFMMSKCHSPLVVELAVLAGSNPTASFMPPASSEEDGWQQHSGAVPIQTH